MSRPLLHKQCTGAGTAVQAFSKLWTALGFREFKVGADGSFVREKGIYPNDCMLWVLSPTASKYPNVWVNYKCGLTETEAVALRMLLLGE